MSTQTNTDTLFTEHNPDTYGYARHADDEFEYMNSHADAPVLAARDVLERWYSHYPAGDRLDFVRRFRRKNQKQHDGAFWELFLHELFRRMGFGVQIHPLLDGIGARPDFLLTRDGVAFAMVEARLAGLEADRMTSAERLKKELHDALDKVHSPNFFLSIENVKTAPIRPSFRRLTTLIEKWLEGLDPDLPMERFLDRRDARHRFEWQHEGWSVSLAVIPKSADRRGVKGSRAVGATWGGCQWLDTKGELRRALAEKSSRYGTLNLPFLIAINYVGAHCDSEDWADALFGSQAVNVWFDERGVHHQEPFRKGDGFWMCRGTPRHTNISAILGASGLNVWSMGAHPVEVYKHFACDYPVDLNEHLPAWCVPPDKNELVLRPGRSSADILGIPKEWPGKWNAD